MGCERCGGRIDRYSLDGREAQVCADCGYVDVPVEHGRPSGPSESWREAFERFYDRFGESPPGEYPVRPVSDGDDSGDDDSRAARETRSSPAADPDVSGSGERDASERVAPPPVTEGQSSRLPEATDGGEPTAAEVGRANGRDDPDVVPVFDRED